MPIRLGKGNKGPTDTRIVSRMKQNRSSSVGLFQTEKYRDGASGMIAFCEDFVNIAIYPPGETSPVWTPLGDLPKDKNPITGRSYHYIWEEQKDILRQCLEMKDGRFLYRLLVFCWMRGEGKCQKKGSKVLMYDGAVKKVEQVVVGDLLMGDNNTPRKVLSLVNGTEEMFKVTPMRGEPLTVTSDHILSLKRRRQYVHRYGKYHNDVRTGNIVDISVNEFQKQTKMFKNIHMLYRTAIDWKEQQVPIDPYFLGMWLGDGTSRNPSITTMDKEVVNYLYQFASDHNLQITKKTKTNNKASTYSLVTKKGQPNPLLNLLRDNNLLCNKHIPQIYKANSREVRLQILAGLMDSDGYINRNSISFTLKNKQLCEDIAFLARSLGLHADIKKVTREIKKINFIGTYYRVYISGDCSIIPSLIPRKKCTPRSNWKDVLVTTIKNIKSVGKQEYYGFMLDGNHRYVTEDFTVTHNSVLACLIQLWKACCFEMQKIVLGANSKDQTKFVHYDIIRDTILFSPELIKRIGIQNVQEKEIKVRNEKGEVTSFIRPISSFSGIMSNITGYTFSEMFDMKNPKFFTQIDGSIRNIPNALGVIDSTVSDKKHVLFQLYTNWIEKKTSTLYFSYRCSKAGDYHDFWNPNMDEAQLIDYKSKFPFGEFEKYFQNTWDAGSSQPFTREMIDEATILDCDGRLMDHPYISQKIARKHQLFGHTQNEGLKFDAAKDSMDKVRNELRRIDASFKRVDSIYTIGKERAPGIVLNQLSDILDTDWAILASADFADPMSQTSSARTVCTILAKGLIGSRKNPMLFGQMESPNYIYFLLSVLIASSAQITRIKDELEACHDEYGGIDAICCERYGSWDLTGWCDERSIAFEPIHPNYERQRAAFREFFNVVRLGLYKKPTVNIPGFKKKDIIEEEMEVFMHDSYKRWFGSPEKDQKYGAQDDTMYSQAWAIYGGRNLSVMEFRIRNNTYNFGTLYRPSEMLGRY